MEQETIKIDFIVDNGVYRFSDALHLPANHTFTEQEIEDMKQTRFNNWIAVITAPAVDLPSEIEQDVIDVADTSTPSETPETNV
jgi:hypothetical protein